MASGVGRRKSLPLRLPRRGRPARNLSAICDHRSRASTSRFSYGSPQARQQSLGGPHLCIVALGAKARQSAMMVKMTIARAPIRRLASVATEEIVGNVRQCVLGSPGQPGIQDLLQLLEVAFRWGPGRFELRVRSIRSTLRSSARSSPANPRAPSARICCTEVPSVATHKCGGASLARQLSLQIPEFTMYSPMGMRRPPLRNRLRTA